MGKLIAQRPILYMGQTFERGGSLPAQDPKMVAAWLKAGSARWEGQKRPQDAPDEQDGREPAGAEESGQGTAQDGGEGEMLTGHLDAAQLARMTKGQLEDLARDMGVDISGAKNNTERAAILAAVEVQAPADGDTP